MPIARRDEVANHIRDRVDSGEWSAGEKVPTTREFAAEYNVGMKTAEEALRALVQSGILEAVRGGGRYVAERTGNVRPRTV